MLITPVPQSNYLLYLLLTHVQNGGSPLYAASQEGHTDVVDILIEAGADVHQARTTV